MSGSRAARAPLVAIIASLAGLATLFVTSPNARADGRHDERYRPQFHFTPERNWTNDPNGMVFYDGEFHLFYQYNPFGEGWGHMSWGHSVAHDLLHWETLPLALPEANDVMIFSGSAVVDWHNTSGFGRDGKPPLVAIYTGNYTNKPLQNQQIAYSNDRGRTWTKFAGNPVLDIGERDFRDPHVFWHEPTKRWVMAVAWSTHREVRFYASTDLKHWTHLSDFGPAGAPEGIWECPDLFPLNLDGKTKWVLIVNTGSGAPAGGSGCQYFVGDFDGARFTLDPRQAAAQDAAPTSKAPALWTDQGPDFYAAVTWNDVPKSDGRRLFLAWMSNTAYAGDIPTAPWRGGMSLPRELGLRATPAGIRLTQTPARELQSLRGPDQHFAGHTLAETNDWLKHNAPSKGYPLELSVHFEAASKGTQAIALFKGAHEQTLVGIDRDTNRVFIDRTHSGNVAFNKRFPGTYAAPLTNAPDGPVQLHCFVDACSIEVFADDGQQVLSTLVFPNESNHTIEVIAPDSTASVPAIDIWPLRSTLK